jgi:hypothetical protein
MKINLIMKQNLYNFFNIMLLFTNNNKLKQIKIENASAIEIIKFFQLLFDNPVIFHSTYFQEFKEILKRVQLINFCIINPSIFEANSNSDRIF